MPAPSPRAPPSKRSAPTGVVDEIISDAAAGISIRDPGGEANSGKRYDTRRSPAHARLDGLASAMAEDWALSPSCGGSVGGSGGGGGCSRNVDYLRYSTNSGDFPFDSDVDVSGLGGWEAALEPAALPSPLSSSLSSTLDSNSSLGSGRGGAGGGLLPGRRHAERAAPVGGKWTKAEDECLRGIVEKHGPKNWKRVAEALGDTRTDVQCLHRWNKVLKPGLHKGPWTEDEDEVVRDTVLEFGVGNIKWSAIAERLPGRIGKQCRERWFNHLDPAIQRGEWSAEEERVLFEAQRVCGNRWSEIAKLLPGRTENAVKNRFNSSARKKWLKDNGLEDRAEGALLLDANRGEIETLLHEILAMHSLMSDQGDRPGDRRQASQGDSTLREPLTKLLGLVQGSPASMEASASSHASALTGHRSMSQTSASSFAHHYGRDPCLSEDNLSAGDGEKDDHDEELSPTSQSLRDLPPSFRPPSLNLVSVSNSSLSPAPEDAGGPLTSLAQTANEPLSSSSVTSQQWPISLPPAASSSSSSSSSSSTRDHQTVAQAAAQGAAQGAAGGGSVSSSSSSVSSTSTDDFAKHHMEQQRQASKQRQVRGHKERANFTQHAHQTLKWSPRSSETPTSAFLTSYLREHGSGGRSSGGSEVSAAAATMNGLLMVPKVDWAKPSPRAGRAPPPASASSDDGGGGDDNAALAWAAQQVRASTNHYRSVEPSDAATAALLPFFHLLNEHGKRLVMQHLVRRFHYLTAATAAATSAAATTADGMPSPPLPTPPPRQNIVIPPMARAVSASSSEAPDVPPLTAAQRNLPPMQLSTTPSNASVTAAAAAAAGFSSSSSFILAPSPGQQQQQRFFGAGSLSSTVPVGVVPTAATGGPSQQRRVLQQQQQQQQWRSGDAQSGGGGAPTPLHAAAALVEPVPGSSDLTQGGAWNHLFQNEGQLAFSDEELKTLWAMSPRNLPQTHGSSSNAASSPPTGNLSASPTPSTTSSAATRQPSAPPPSMASSDSYEAAVAAAASQLRSSGSNNSLSAPGR